MSDLSLTNAIGFAAAGLVLATFCMHSMKPLRLVAIASNVAFIAYAYLAGLAPVLLLHTVLLPVNVYRLTQLRRACVRKEPTRARLRTHPFFEGLHGEVLNRRGGAPGQTGGSKRMTQR
jgi:fatty acid desaturase